MIMIIMMMIPVMINKMHNIYSHFVTHRINQVTFIILFPKQKEFAKGRKFTDDEDVICIKWLAAFFTTESELWRNAGPSAFYLQKNMLKSDKIGWSRLSKK